MSRVHPSWSQILREGVNLGPGIGFLARFLDEHLPPEWEIYPQPYLNGDRPDLVLLNPDVGVMIYEIKNWDLSAFYREGRTVLLRGHGDDYGVLNPLAQVARHRENILGQYLPLVGEIVDGDHRAFGVIKAGVYFHGSKGTEARQLLRVPENRDPRQKADVVIGSDDLLPENLDLIVPDVWRHDSWWWTAEWGHQLRTLLCPGRHSNRVSNPLILNPVQQRYAEPRPGHHRLKGAAGSGKTAILASRAANLASQGYRVLLVCFNITLWHYLRYLVRRMPYDFDERLIEYRHFHGFCQKVLYHYGSPGPGLERVTEAVLDIARSGVDTTDLQYDAILVDEGQDFRQEWIDLLSHFLTNRNELVLVADERQNLYRRDLSWLRGDSARASFRGPWLGRGLERSVRLPPVVAEQAESFARQFMPMGDQIVPLGDPQGHFADTELLWANCSVEQAKDQLLPAYQYLANERGHRPSDIAILLPSHDFGLEMVGHFRRKGIQVNHVFDERAPEGYRGTGHKRAFWIEDTRLKMSTIHSFKGWEVPNLVLLIHRTESTHIDELASAVYSALTRTARWRGGDTLLPASLIVLNCDPQFNEYGDGWPKRWELRSGSLDGITGELVIPF